MVERCLKFLLIILLCLHLTVLTLGFIYVRQSVFQERVIPHEHRSFLIEEGSSLTEVLRHLHREGLSPQPLVVRLGMIWKGKEIVVKKGRYHLPELASTWEMLTLFDEGRVQLFKVTIPEGLDKWQVAELLGAQIWGDASAFQEAIDDPSPITELDPEAEDLEGYLFPETYFFPEEATPGEIVQKLVNAFKQETRSLREGLPGRGLSIRRLTTLASMVERETSISNERALIAGVFQNRLDRGMLLQCDPTIIYSLKREGQFKGKIYRSQIRFDSPYNTYVYKDLPPGPIASPGLASLEAALFPLDTEYLYFVARPDGSHHFSRSLGEHNRAVRRYLRRR